MSKESKSQQEKKREPSIGAFVQSVFEKTAEITATTPTEKMIDRSRIFGRDTLFPGATIDDGRLAGSFDVDVFSPPQSPPNKTRYVEIINSFHCIISYDRDNEN